MMYYGSHMSGWGWFAMSISAAAFWGLAVAVVVLLAGALRRRPTEQRLPPEQLLAERFARGEIDRTEYRDRLATLRAHGRS